MDKSLHHQWQLKQSVVVGSIMHFKNQNLCLTSVHFKQVLRHPPIDITYAGFDPRFWSIQKTGKPEFISVQMEPHIMLVDNIG